jgi:LmbE family N-acetylglucosaminyl deacetylase
MKNNYKVIVAHPDDEIIFFSSILKNASKIVTCFGKSDDQNVNIGRQKLKTQMPLNNFLFLDLVESAVFNSANWKHPNCITEGIEVKKNKNAYQENFQNLKLQLSKVINYGETIYTHNPWGEYGHEEHVQVFHAIMALATDLNLKIFVNSYVSNKSYSLMIMKQHLLSDEKHINTPDLELASVLKKIYQSNSCWTFYDNYCWPKTELFYRVIIDKTYTKTTNTKTSSPPLNILSGNYKTTFFKKLAGKILPTNMKIILKRLLDI